ncbi:helix-turn-helix domain-containing protein [Rothia sp. p3-SID1597]|nr:helix-turn-helix domain-containing protein [Rothia sp. p3-SID1597]
MTSSLETSNQRLYTVKEAAEQLGVSIPFIYKRIEKGHIPYVDIGIGRAKTRIRATDLENYIQAHTHTNKAA